MNSCRVHFATITFARITLSKCFPLLFNLVPSLFLLISSVVALMFELGIAGCFPMLILSLAWARDWNGVYWGVGLVFVP